MFQFRGLGALFWGATPTLETGLNIVKYDQASLFTRDT